MKGFVAIDGSLIDLCVRCLVQSWRWCNGGLSLEQNLPLKVLPHINGYYVIDVDFGMHFEGFWYALMAIRFHGETIS